VPGGDVRRLGGVLGQVVQFDLGRRPVPDGLPLTEADGLDRAAFMQFPVEAVSLRRGASLFRKSRRFMDCMVVLYQDLRTVNGTTS